MLTTPAANPRNALRLREIFIATTCVVSMRRDLELAQNGFVFLELGLNILRELARRRSPGLYTLLKKSILYFLVLKSVPHCQIQSFHDEVRRTCREYQALREACMSIGPLLRQRPAPLVIMESAGCQRYRVCVPFQPDRVELSARSTRAGAE